MENRTRVFGIEIPIDEIFLRKTTAGISYQYNSLKHFYMHYQLHLFLKSFQFNNELFSLSSFTISSVLVHLYQENRQSSSYTSFIYRPSLMAMFI